MSLYKTLFLAIALSLSTLGFTAPVADAQETKIVVVDNSRVLRESAGGQDMRRKLSAIGQSMQTELEGEASILDTERRALAARGANLTPEAIAADTQLQSQGQAFQAKAQAFQLKNQRSSQELQLTERNALGAFEQALAPVIEAIVAETGADIVFDRSQLVFASPTLDITDQVIARLNTQSPTIAVTRARLPAQQTAPETIQ